jgi:hypothetical protein
MKATPSTSLSQLRVDRAAGKDKPYEITDGTVRGLRLRVQPSGVKMFYLDWPKRAGLKGTRIKIGRANALHSRRSAFGGEAAATRT